LKKIFNYLLIGAMAFNLGTANADENTKKEVKSKKEQSTFKNSDDEIFNDIVADEVNEENINKPLIGKDDNKQAKKNKKDENKAVGDTNESEGSKKLYFSMSTKNRLGELKEKRMQEYYFHAKLSNDFFKIYEDDDNYVIHCKMPFAEKDCDITTEFKDETNLFVTFKHKTNKDEKPVRYEIVLPKPTEKKIFKIVADGQLEITTPIDFFMAERMERQKGTK